MQTAERVWDSTLQTAPRRPGYEFVVSEGKTGKKQNANKRELRFHFLSSDF